MKTAFKGAMVITVGRTFLPSACCALPLFLLQPEAREKPKKHVDAVVLTHMPLDALVDTLALL